MKRRLTSLYGDCAADDCVHGDCCGHISEGSVVQWVDIRGLWAPLLMMQMLEFCFGLWLWMTYSQGRSSLPRGCWSLSLASSCWWRIAREWKTEKRAAFLLPTLLLLFLPVVLTCDKGMPWVTSSGTISVFLFYLSLFVATFLIFCVFCIFFLWWLKLISPHVEGHIRNYVAHFNSKRLCSACLSCLLDCCFLLCTAHPLFSSLSFVLLFSFSSNSSYSNLSRFLPLFSFFCMTDSHLHFLTSSSSSLPLLSPLPSAWGFLWSPFHLLFADATFSPLSLNLSSFISLQDIWPSHILNLWSPNSHFRHEVMCVYVCSPRWKFVFVCLGHALY